LQSFHCAYKGKQAKGQPSLRLSYRGTHYLRGHELRIQFAKARSLVVFAAALRPVVMMVVVVMVVACRSSRLRWQRDRSREAEGQNESQQKLFHV
jgi:hypothetical protein